MGKEDIIKTIDEILRSNGFKRKGNTWIAENNVLFKIVQLQKSNFGSYYYLNFGINLKSLDSKNIDMHIFNRLGSQDKSENEEISNLLAIEINIPEENRKNRLEKYISEKVIKYFQAIDTENDVKNSIGKWTSLNTIPLIVKKHFHLIE